MEFSFPMVQKYEWICMVVFGNSLERSLHVGTNKMDIWPWRVEFSCLWVIAAAIKIIPKMETIAAAIKTIPKMEIIAAAMIAVFGIDSCCSSIW